jgi:hypothetical protein
MSFELYKLEKSKRLLPISPVETSDVYRQYAGRLRFGGDLGPKPKVTPAPLGISRLAWAVWKY